MYRHSLVQVHWKNAQRPHICFGVGSIRLYPQVRQVDDVYQQTMLRPSDASHADRLHVLSQA